MRRTTFGRQLSLCLGVGVAAVILGACAASGSPSSQPSASSVPTSALASSAAVSAATPAASPTVTLSGTFTSPVYGYTIGLAPDWTVTAATLRADDPASTDETANDVITVTGTDTTIPTLAWDLGAQDFSAWLDDYRAAMSAGVPPGCDGGDPSKWPAVPVGIRQGVWQQKCNAAVATVEFDGKAYQFAWENSTFDGTKHLSESAFKAVLATVTFPTASASASPTP